MTTIQESTLRELVVSQSTLSAGVVGCVGGFTVSVLCGGSTRTLTNTRGSVRTFSNLTNLAVFLHGLGIPTFNVDTTAYVPGRVRSARPDRAEALRRTRTVPRQTELLK